MYADLLCELIEKNKKNKWLIFVDSKKFGSQLRKSIVEHFGMTKKEADEDVVFLFADNIRDSSTQEAFGSIVGKEMLSSRIVISTAVLDNGVTIKDMELRDIVVFADMEYELIQMLGRKRKDGENLRVYLANYNR